MSLLMQALKKAERTKQNSLLDEEAAEKPSEAFDGVLALTQQDLTPEQLNPRAAEFSLEPLDDRLMPEIEAEQIPALTPAEEAPHDPTPPQARVGNAALHRAELTLQDLHEKPAQAAPFAPALSLQPDGLADTSLADTGLANTRLPNSSEQDAGTLAPSPAAALAATGKPDARTGERRQNSGQRISDHFSSSAGNAAGSPQSSTGAQDGPEGRDGRSGDAAKPAAGASARPAAPSGAAILPGTTSGTSGRAEPGNNAAGRSEPGNAAAGRSGPASGAAAKARAAAAARATAAENKVGWDPARIRIAVLGGILLLVVALFGYIYWRAVASPGPGAGLPMVPMPPPDAAGAKTGAIVVAPGPAAVGDQAIAPDPAHGPAYGPSPLSSSLPIPAPIPPAVAAPAARGPSGTSSMLGSARGAAPASSTVMATPEEIERAMQMQAGQQGGSPPPFAAAAPVQPASAQAAPGQLSTDPGSAGPADIPGTAGKTPGGTETRPDSGWSSSDIKVSRRSNAPRINPALQYGYRALLDGDLPTAADQYATALRQDPNNRDALLGSAAVALRRNDTALASASYMRLLELDPSDPEAQADMLSLRPGDTGQSERRLKELLRKAPDSAPLQFALGNLYSQQARWTDAQQAYFRAYTASPDNPDYAFNLAVGLDRLNQPKLALTYYQRALALSQAGPAGFDSEAVRARMRQLAEPN